MASFWLNQNDTSVKIPSVKEVSGVFYYTIQVTVGEIKWTISHRYSEFYDLHNELVLEHGISKDKLPSKKIIWSKCPEFIETRRRGLEQYLQEVFNFLKRTMPRPFLEFLDFHLYDVFFLLQNLAMKHFTQGESLLTSKNGYQFTPLELYALSQYCKNPAPTLVNIENQYDITHVLDLATQLKMLLVNGSNNNYLQSNIVPNNLSFDFISFKNITRLVLVEISLNHIQELGNLRYTLHNLSVHKTSMMNICQILQCDVIHKCTLDDKQVWKSLTVLDLSNNNLIDIDNSIKLVPELQILRLNQNKISCLSDLSFLYNLVELSLCNNLITSCSDLHTKLGKISSLNLSGNSISSLEGFSKLYSLESLNLSCNNIADIKEITYVGDLPCLENLILTGNSVATVIDYRVKVLEQFGDRGKDICLDNEKPSQQEMDKVSIRTALRMVKEGKSPSIINS